MAVKKIYKPANTNNFGSIKTHSEQNAPITIVSAKTLSEACKSSAQSTGEKKNK